MYKTLQILAPQTRNSWGFYLEIALKYKVKQSENGKLPSNYCWFSHDVTKIQTKKLSILPRFYFHDALEQLKTNSQTNFCFKRFLGFVIEYA